MNDIDIEMAELSERANMLARGVCPSCEEYMREPGEPERADGEYSVIRSTDLDDRCDGCAKAVRQEMREIEEDRRMIEEMRRESRGRGRR